MFFDTYIFTSIYEMNNRIIVYDRQNNKSWGSFLFVDSLSADWDSYHCIYSNKRRNCKSARIIKYRFPEFLYWNGFFFSLLRAFYLWICVPLYIVFRELSFSKNLIVYFPIWDPSFFLLAHLLISFFLRSKNILFFHGALCSWKIVKILNPAWLLVPNYNNNLYYRSLWIPTDTIFPWVPQDILSLKLEKKYDFIYIGRLIPGKWIEDLIFLFDYIKKYFWYTPSLSIFWSWKKDYVKMLNELILKKWLKNITLEWEVTWEKKNIVLNSSRAFISLSHAESLWISILESLSLGIPTIAYDLYNYREFEGVVWFFKFQIWDYSSIASKVIEIFLGDDVSYDNKVVINKKFSRKSASQKEKNFIYQFIK